jgi:hypothetical protein
MTKSLVLLWLLLTPATALVPCQTSGCPVGSTVHTIATANVRATCSVAATIVKTEPAGAQAIVTSGPVPTAGGFDYLGVRFSDGVSGCVGDDNTTLVTIAPPPATPPVYTLTVASGGVTLFTVTCSSTNGVYSCK